MFMKWSPPITYKKAFSSQVSFLEPPASDKIPLIFIFKTKNMFCCFCIKSADF